MTTLYHLLNPSVIIVAVALIGNGCLREDGFRCGTSAQCVSRLHVCDGWRDCMNGEDEVADMCGE